MGVGESERKTGSGSNLERGTDLVTIGRREGCYSGEGG